jgi:hypothetical protein
MSGKVRPPNSVHWSKESCRTANWILGFGFFFTSFPVFWNEKEMKMEITKNKWHLRRYKGLVFIVSLLSLSLGILLSLRIYKTGIKPQNYRETMFLYITSFTLAFTPFTWHTMWKINEIQTFINSAKIFYDDFQGKKRRISYIGK